MYVLILFFIISGIFLLGYFKKKKMIVANYFYLISFAVLLIIFPFICESKTVITIIKNILSSEQYEFVSSALKCDDYVFGYMFIVTFLTFIQICIFLSEIEKRIRITIYQYKKTFEEVKIQKVSENFQEQEFEESIKLYKVFKKYCKMMN